MTDTAVIVKRLRRLAKWMDQAAWQPAERARVNLVTQAADRLEHFMHCSVALSQSDSQRFVETLVAPPQSNARLAAAAKRRIREGGEP